MHKVLTSVLLLLAFTCSAQLHPILDNFNIVQIGNTVQINFAVKGGASCVGVDLERSGEEFDFEIVGGISGVCGGSEFVEFYSIQDERPLASQKSFYRLRLGSQGRTELIEFTFVPLENGLKVFPNPASDRCFIRFDNSNFVTHRIEVFNSQGVLVQRIESSSSQVELNLDSFILGMYFIRIERDSDGSVVRGKFVKV